MGKEIYDLLREKPEITPKEINGAMDFALEQVRDNLKDFTYSFKRAFSEQGFYTPTENVNWTTGFWTGQVWLAWEWARKQGQREPADELKKAGEVHIDSFLDRILHKREVDHHDMGFLYSPSCVAGYKLTGSEKGREAAVKAADQLITRFHPVGEFIQAWGPMDQPENYRFIIDCLLNLPLLYWASQETGDEKYREIAEKHIHTAIANVIREDYSTWHTFFMNMETGAPDHGATCQGYRDGSAWARGQAWGVYGTAMAYRYTGRKEYIEDFKHVTGYFLEHLPLDLVPYWDLEFGEGSDEPRDSSSASIAACGMLEMAGYMDQKEGEYYKGIARKIMKSVADNYAVKSPKESNGLVLHSTYSKKSPYNTCTPEGVDECNIWGDYFYMEALTRLAGEWNPYW
ncbi:MAG: glucoronyl hydrolase [Hungatella sp.]|nr:glucoronyl hydrolase [Hungatella sp.]